MTSRALINPLPKNSGVSLRATIQNPRPRKYASDADRQKAFRERQAMIQIRVAPKAVETFDEIAETLGYSRQEVVYALLMKGLMSLGNWETVGLPVDWQRKMPQFKLPRYEENPMKRKATPAQLAARERFAAMARSGAFKRKAKKNPAKKTSARPAPGPGDKTVYKRYTIVHPTSGDWFYIVRDGVNIGSARSVQEAKNLIDMLTEGLPNPRKKTVSQKISQLVREGYPQPQAVAIALSEESKGKVRKNPAERERKPRVVLITNPKQRMLNVSWLTAGGQREIMKVPIDFVFTHYVGNVAERFFARTENGQLIVSEYSTGGKIGQVPFTMRSEALNDRAAAKRYVGEMLSRIGAERFKAAVKKFEPIN